MTNNKLSELISGYFEKVLTIFEELRKDIKELSDRISRLENKD